MTEITIIDSIMGTGKTSYAIQRMKEASTDERFIYITPFLDEIERVKAAMNNRNIVEPNNANDEGTKLRSLKQLIAEGYDIAATHSLFKSADDELIELLEGAGYTLILDEVMDVVQPANINQQDIYALLESGYIEIDDETGQVYWRNEGYLEGRFNDIRLFAKAGNLYSFDNSFIVWAFPVRVFKTFDRVVVMTYLFDGQLQKAYYDLNGLQYGYKSIKKDEDGRYILTEYDRQKENREQLIALIDIYEGKLNEVGDRPTSFSSSWLSNAGKKTLDKVRNNTANYFRRHSQTKVKENLWTTKKERKDRLGGSGYKSAWIPVNTRATNEYKDRKACAYLFNRYMNPYERKYFESRGVKVNQDLLAASDLLQWIYRSRIREGKPIHLYIPSARMRGLLKAWGNYEI
ncbi:hypothetical protein [Evansella halocellulosilytica]|uniref:hypothetical protein n=1 Tax=Evansella halocellulosilytica TaxID=2011013 RepID=UPI000BB89573|nr:hypothetical protein [Evansella halocellulosilytica]